MRNKARQAGLAAESVILAADTVVAVGRRILPKAETMDEAASCLRLLSGRAHRVFTGVCVLSVSGHARERLVDTRIRFKRLSNKEIEAYLASGELEWQGRRIRHSGHRGSLCGQTERVLFRCRRLAAV